MNIGEYSVRNKVVSWMLAIVLVGGGVWGLYVALTSMP